VGFVKGIMGRSRKMAKILIGTCGYSYKEWVGPFYPEGAKADDYLSYYAGQFPTVEIDYTYYRMPQADKLRRMLEIGGPDLTFSIKATDTLTHRIDPNKWRDEAKTYIKAIEPMLTAGRLEGVLFQFPYSFHYNDNNRKHLDSLLKEFTGIPSVVEFRHNDWVNNRVFEGLKNRGVAYASLDLPDLKGLPPVLDVSTSPLAYFRLHGRNADSWWESSNSKERYDYLYSDAELEGAVERIKLIMTKAERLLVYFNNHTFGKATRNALTLKKILEKAGLLIAREMQNGERGAGDSPS
jgi:uncharacterized protein YecE (DUF72 family)